MQCLSSGCLGQGTIVGQGTIHQPTLQHINVKVTSVEEDYFLLLHLCINQPLPSSSTLLTLTMTSASNCCFFGLLLRSLSPSASEVQRQDANLWASHLLEAGNAVCKHFAFAPGRTGLAWQLATFFLFSLVVTFCTCKYHSLPTPSPNFPPFPGARVHLPLLLNRNPHLSAPSDLPLSLSPSSCLGPGGSMEGLATSTVSSWDLTSPLYVLPSTSLPSVLQWYKLINCLPRVCHLEALTVSDHSKESPTFNRPAGRCEGHSLWRQRAWGNTLPTSHWMSPAGCWTCGSLFLGADLQCLVQGSCNVQWQWSSKSEDDTAARASSQNCNT